MQDPIKIILPVDDNGIIPPVKVTEPIIEKIKIDDVEYDTDENGNAVKDGKVFKTKAEIEELTKAKAEPIIEDEQFDIDGKLYKIDKDGNALNEDNTIFMTKDAIAKLSEVPEEHEDTNPILVIQNEFEFKPEENGVPIVYENTKEGIVKLTNDIAEAKAVSIFESHIDRFFEENPDIAQLRNHKLRTGTIEGFAPQQDWTKLDATTLSDEDLSNIILIERISKGDTKERAQYFLDSVKKDEKLKEFGAESLKFLADTQTTNAKLVADLEKKRAKDELEANTNYWKEIKNKITSKTLKVNNNDFSLPDTVKVKDSNGKIVTKTLNDFQDYISKPLSFVINNKPERLTQHQYDQYIEQTQRRVDNDIFEAFRRFVKYDDEQIVTKKVQDKEIKIIKKLVTGIDKSKTNTKVNALSLELPIK